VIAVDLLFGELSQKMIGIDLDPFLAFGANTLNESLEVKSNTYSIGTTNLVDLDILHKHI